ncbi:unnamed protein product [Withania somnifera]
MSNPSSANISEEADETLNVLSSTSDGSSALPSPNKKRRKLPGNPVKAKTSNEIKKRVYICPEISCIHHNPARALGDLTGIKKHFSRKHGEKKWKCDRCSKKYAVQSDWKAHSKTCGTKEYKCDCGTIFSRKDSFVTHRAFCDALAEENNKVNQILASGTQPASTGTGNTQLPPELLPNTSIVNLLQINNSNMAGSMFSCSSGFNQPSTNSSNMSSATLLLQQAAQMGATVSINRNSPVNVVRKSYTCPFNGMQIPIRSDHDHIQAQIGSNIVHGFVGSTLQNSSNDHQKTSRLMQIETGWHNNANNTLFNEKQRILNKEGGHRNEDGLTLDFLGIRGMREVNLHEIAQQQQQQMEVSKQSIHVENSMWDD